MESRALTFERIFDIIAAVHSISQMRLRLLLER